MGIDIRRYRPEPNWLGWLSDMNIKTVMDIGANTGQFINEIRGVLPDCFIYSFEPLRDCFEELLAARKGDLRFKGFNIALGDENGETVIKRSTYTPSSSLLKMGQLHEKLYPHTKGQKDEKITIKRLDDIKGLNPQNMERNILVKMDVQGYEDKVIAGAVNFIRNTRVILTETSFLPLYEGQKLFADIYKTLHDLGFDYAGAIHQKPHKENGRIIFEDAIFIKKN